MLFHLALARGHPHTELLFLIRRVHFGCNFGVPLDRYASIFVQAYAWGDKFLQIHFERCVRGRCERPIRLQGGGLGLRFSKAGNGHYGSFDGRRARRRNAKGGSWRSEIEGAGSPVTRFWLGISSIIKYVGESRGASSRPRAISRPMGLPPLFDGAVLAQKVCRWEGDVRRPCATRTIPHFGVPGRISFRCIMSFCNRALQTN